MDEAEYLEWLGTQRFPVGSINLNGLPDSLIDAITNIIKMFQRKNADYADGGVWYENFQIEETTGLSAQDAVEALIAIKTGRLKVLRAKARRGSDEAVNEPALDTYEDRAVYALISYAMYLEGER